MGTAFLGAIAGCGAPEPFPFGESPTPTAEFAPEPIDGEEGGWIHALLSDPDGGPGATWMETIDVRDMSRRDVAELAGVGVSIDAFPGDPGQAFIADRSGRRLLVHSAAFEDAVPLPSDPVDLVYVRGPNGHQVMVATTAELVVVTDGPQVSVIGPFGRRPRAIAIGGPAFEGDGLRFALAMVEGTAGLVTVGRIDLTQGAFHQLVGAGCNPLPDDVWLFGDRLFVWDSGCDRLYQSPVPGTGMNDVGLTIEFPTDDLPARAPSNQIAFSDLSLRLFVPGSEGLQVADPFAAIVLDSIVLPDPPTALSTSRDGKTVWAATASLGSNGFPAISAFDTESWSLSTDVFAFPYRGGFVRDLTHNDRAPRFLHNADDLSFRVSVKAKSDLRFVLPFVDPEGDPIRFAPEAGLPGDMTLNPYTGLVTWTPGCSQSNGTTLVFRAESSRWRSRGRVRIDVRDCPSCACRLGDPAAAAPAAGSILLAAMMAVMVGVRLRRP